jgi:hypothetical protein
MTRLESGDPDVLAWIRSTGDETLLVLVSFVGAERTIDLGAIAPGSWSARVGSHRVLPDVPRNGARLRLRPDEALILARTDD